MTKYLWSAVLLAACSVAAIWFFAGHRTHPLTVAERLKLRPPRCEPQVNNVKVTLPLQYPHALSPLVLRDLKDREFVEPQVPIEPPPPPLDDTAPIALSPNFDPPPPRMRYADEEPEQPADWCSWMMNLPICRQWQELVQRFVSVMGWNMDGAGDVLPAGEWLLHPPQFFPPSPNFPLPREMKSTEDYAPKTVQPMPPADDVEDPDLPDETGTPEAGQLLGRVLRTLSAFWPSWATSAEEPKMPAAEVQSDPPQYYPFAPYGFFEPVPPDEMQLQDAANELRKKGRAIEYAPPTPPTDDRPLQPMEPPADIEPEGQADPSVLLFLKGTLQQILASPSILPSVTPVPDEPVPQEQSEADDVDEQPVSCQIEEEDQPATKSGPRWIETPSGKRIQFAPAFVGPRGSGCFVPNNQPSGPPPSVYGPPPGCRKKVIISYEQVTKTLSEEHKRVVIQADGEPELQTYTVDRTARGAYVDDEGESYLEDGPGREFEEGALVKIERVETTCKLEPSPAAKAEPTQRARMAKHYRAAVEALMKEAAALMKQDQFEDALELYEFCERLLPQESAPRIGIECAKIGIKARGKGDTWLGSVARSFPVPGSLEQSPEELKLVHFWHDYVDAMERCRETGCRSTWAVPTDGDPLVEYDDAPNADPICEPNRNPDENAQDPASAAGPAVSIDKLFQDAFGEDCDEMARCIRVFLRSRGIAFAANSFEVGNDQRVKLSPFSMVIRKAEKDGSFPETITVRCETAYLTLDEPVTVFSDIAKRNIVAVETIGGIKISHNRGTSFHLQPLADKGGQDRTDSEKSKASDEDDPAPPPLMAQRSYVKQNYFNLPLNMTEEIRSNLSEIHLWCFDPSSGKWRLLAKCPPTQTGFDFDSREGEYRFTLTLVDLLRRSVPERPEQAQFHAVVVVDTTPPTLDAQFVGCSGNGFLIKVDVRDAHPDPSKTVLEYQTSNKEWRAVEQPIAPRSDSLSIPRDNRFCIPKDAVVTGLVRVTAADLSGNQACKEFELPLLQTAARERQATAGVTQETTRSTQSESSRETEGAFTLERVSAQCVADIVNNLYADRYPVDGDVEHQVRATFSDTCNVVCVQAGNDADFKEIEELIEVVDSEYKLKVLNLQRALSDDVAKFVRSAVFDGPPVRAATSFADAKDLAGEPKFLSLMRQAGCLDDVRIKSEPTRNLLVVCAPDKLMNLIDEMVQVLDASVAGCGVQCYTEQDATARTKELIKLSEQLRQRNAEISRLLLLEDQSHPTTGIQDQKDELSPADAEQNAATWETRQKVADLSMKALRLIQDGDMAGAMAAYKEAGKLLPKAVEHLVATTLPSPPAASSQSQPSESVRAADFVNALTPPARPVSAHCPSECPPAPPSFCPSGETTRNVLHPFGDGTGLPPADGFPTARVDWWQEWNAPFAAGDAKLVPVNDGAGNESASPSSSPLWKFVGDLASRILPSNDSDLEFGVDLGAATGSSVGQRSKPTENTTDEANLQQFWHDYYDALAGYYKSLADLNWAAFYKNHGYVINPGEPGGPRYAPMFATAGVSGMPDNNRYFQPNAGWTSPPYPGFFPVQRALPQGYYGSPRYRPYVGYGNCGYALPSPAVCPPGLVATSCPLSYVNLPAPMVRGSRLQFAEEDAGQLFLNTQHEKLTEAMQQYEDALEEARTNHVAVEACYQEICGGSKEVDVARLRAATALWLAAMQRREDAVARYNQTLAAFGPLPGSKSETAETLAPAAGQRTQIKFTEPAGMKVTWFGSGFDGPPRWSPMPLEVPSRYNFVQGATYRLKIDKIDYYPLMEFYPTLEVLPATAKSQDFLAHSAVPLAFTRHDLQMVMDGNYLVRVIYLPHPEYQADVGGGVAEIVSTLLDPGTDPVKEARKRGTVLAVVRLGNVQQELSHSPPLDGSSPAEQWYSVHSSSTIILGFGASNLPTVSQSPQSVPSPSLPPPPEKDQQAETTPAPATSETPSAGGEPSSEPAAPPPATTMPPDYHQQYPSCPYLNGQYCPYSHQYYPSMPPPAPQPPPATTPTPETQATPETPEAQPTPSAQPEASPMAPKADADVYLLRSRVFHFPVHIDKEMVSQTKEVSLYMRDGQGPEWQLVETVPPTATTIRCSVPRDGQYSFQIVTVDLLGRPSLTNLKNTPPAMTVMVDTSFGQAPAEKPATPPETSETPATATPPAAKEEPSSTPPTTSMPPDYHQQYPSCPYLNGQYCPYTHQYYPSIPAPAPEPPPMPQTQETPNAAQTPEAQPAPPAKQDATPMAETSETPPAVNEEPSQEPNAVPPATSGDYHHDGCPYLNGHYCRPFRYQSAPASDVQETPRLPLEPTTNEPWPPDDPPICPAQFEKTPGGASPPAEPEMPWLERTRRFFLHLFGVYSSFGADLRADGSD